MVKHLIGEEWRYVSMECGGLCVMIVGMSTMPQLCVNNLGIVEVSSLYAIASFNSSLQDLYHFTDIQFHQMSLIPISISCGGYEDLLSDCEHRGVGIHDCAEKYEEAGVICNSESYTCIMNNIFLFYRYIT